AGAGSLGVLLGGAAIYHGQEEIRPPLGAGPAPVATDLSRAIALIRRSLWLWLAAFFVIGFLHA
ncbi:MAG TPA: cobalamin biosynthesis protein, partial [Azonexus sp.]|nr:cobalamin biosynthesis protein [Azonexus sp.]